MPVKSLYTSIIFWTKLSGFANERIERIGNIFPCWLGESVYDLVLQYKGILQKSNSLIILRWTTLVHHPHQMPQDAWIISVTRQTRRGDE